MKVYDCFMFYNEFELLELRLESLWDVVDYFVLVEADRSHINQPEPFYFNERKDEFKKYASKIRHFMINLDFPYKGAGDWTLENAHRNSIILGLQDAEPNDLIFISDADEIPAPDILQRIKNRQAPLIAPYILPAYQRPDGTRLFVPCRLMIDAVELLEISPIALDQNFHYYYLNLAAKGTWQGTVLTKRKNLTKPQDMRNLRTFLPRIPEGGWHFSYMGGVDRIIDKMTSIVDGSALVEQSGGKLADKKHIEIAMQTGSDLYGRKNATESQFYPCDIDNIKLPYIQEFVRKYPHFLRND